MRAKIYFVNKCSLISIPSYSLINFSVKCNVLCSPNNLHIYPVCHYSSHVEWNYAAGDKIQRQTWIHSRCNHQRYFKQRGIRNVIEGIYPLRSSIRGLSHIIINSTPLNSLSAGSSIYVGRIESLCNTSCGSNLPYSDVVVETPVRWLHRPELRQQNTYPISKI